MSETAPEPGAGRITLPREPTPEILAAMAGANRDERVKWGWTEIGKKVRAIDEIMARAAYAALVEHLREKGNG
jgi:hypothetical protein